MIKKVVRFVTSLLLISMIFSDIDVHAATGSQSLKGPSQVWAGDTITLTYVVNGTDILGISGAISYDSSQVEMTSKSSKTPKGWDSVNFNGTKFVTSDTTQNNPINSSTTIFTVTFKVNSSLQPGTKVSISITGAKYSGSDYKSHSFSDAVYSFTVQSPKSDNAYLARLSAAEGSISPSFVKTTTAYSLSVPYSVSKLSITAVPEDSKAKVSISNPTLKAGGHTTVTITVTSQAGNTMKYTINVYREQDPNYVPSNNADAEWIKVQGYVLSPAFSKDVTQYVVWVPYEEESVVTTAKAADPKAEVDIKGGESLVVGDNDVKVTITAEDGTQKVYTVVVKRADTHDHDNDKGGSRSSEADLISMDIYGGEISPEINPDILEYDVEVDNSVSEFFSNYVVSEGATASFIPKPGLLKIGESTYVLQVTAADGETVRYYVFNVNRSDKPVKCTCWTCVNLWWLLILAFVLGFGMGALIFGRKKKKNQQNNFYSVR